jgi:hypothetical protein
MCKVSRGSTKSIAVVVLVLCCLSYWLNSSMAVNRLRAYLNEGNDTNQQYIHKMSLLKKLFPYLKWVNLPKGLGGIEDKLYDPAQSTRRNHQNMIKSLEWFDQSIATPNKIKYKLAFGTLLGYVRERRIIEDDTDMDIQISLDGLKILEELVHNKKETQIMDQWDHPKIKTGTSNEMIILFRAQNHHLPDQVVPRKDCSNNIVARQQDPCSFNGPVGRIYNLGSKEYPHMTYIDIFLTLCPYDAVKAKTTQLSWGCQESTRDCLYCSSSAAIQDESMNELERCELNGVNTWCPTKAWYYEFLKDNYGINWRVPDSGWSTDAGFLAIKNQTEVIDFDPLVKSYKIINSDRYKISFGRSCKNECGSARGISSKEECEKAASVLKLDFSMEEMDSESSVPPGCYIRRDFRIFFNLNDKAVDPCVDGSSDNEKWRAVACLCRSTTPLK